MRIACTDLDRPSQEAVKHLIDTAYLECRNAVASVPLIETACASTSEIVINSRPGAIVVGPQMGLERAYKACRELKAAHRETPIILFYSEEDYSLRALKRFENLVAYQFKTSEDPARIMHCLSLCTETAKNAAKGRLVVVAGVKGGVGATSVVSALAHCAEEREESAVVVDLSPAGVLPLYMATSRFQSSDYRTAITENIIPEESTMKQCVVTAPNGIDVLLPPSDSASAVGQATPVREKWIRGERSFESTLTMLELLVEKYSSVIVDLAGAEGILPFALLTRADEILLVSSNDPASVHLLAKEVAKLRELPTEANVRVLINEVFERGVSKKDIVDCLSVDERFEPSLVELRSVPCDQSARTWIGTGNSFYTEAKKATQKALLAAYDVVCLGEAAQRAGTSLKKKSRLKALARKRAALDAPKRALTDGNKESKLSPEKALKSSALLEGPKPAEDDQYSAPKLTPVGASEVGLSMEP